MSFTKLPSALKLASFNKNCPEKCPEISPKISPEIGLAECGHPDPYSMSYIALRYVNKDSQHMTIKNI